MKNTLYLFLFLTLLCSCKEKEKSDEDIIKEVVEIKVKNTLYYPDSYEPVKTEVKNLGVNMLNDKTISKAVHIYDLIEKINEIQRTVDYYIDLRDNYPPNHNQYKYCDSQVQNQVSKRMKVESQVSNELNKLRREYANAEKGKYGYFVNHSYRAKNNLGYINFVNLLIVLNPNKEIVKIYDYNDPKIMKFSKICDIISEMGLEDIPNEDIDLENTVEEIKSFFN